MEMSKGVGLSSTHSSQPKVGIPVTTVRTLFQLVRSHATGRLEHLSKNVLLSLLYSNAFIGRFLKPLDTVHRFTDLQITYRVYRR